MEEEMYGDPYQQPIQKDEVVSKSSFAMRSEDRLQRRKADEGAPQVNDAEDGGIQFLAPEGTAGVLLWALAQAKEFSGQK